MRATARITEVPSAIIVQFANTFVVWIVAERIGLSGILTIVAYAITVARTAPARIPARLRVPSYAVWETAVFVLNVLAFVLIGLQLQPIWQRLDQPLRLHYCLIAAIVLAVVILTRIIWVMSYSTACAILDRAVRLSSEAADGAALGCGRHRCFMVRDARHRHAGGGVRAAG